MNKKHYYIVFIILSQFIFLFTVIFLRWWHIYSGEKILVEIQGYDPLDYMRGYYSRINLVIKDYITVDNNTRLNQYVYVPYFVDENNIAIFENPVLEKPKNKKYIRGIIDSYQINNNSQIKFLYNDKIYTYKSYDVWFFYKYNIKNINLNNTDYYICIDNDNNNDTIYNVHNITKEFVNKDIYYCNHELNRHMVQAKFIDVQISFDAQIRFNIDTFYGDKNITQKLEEDLRIGDGKKYAKIAVNKDGDMQLIEIIANNNVYR